MKPMWNNRNLRLLVLGQASSLVGNYTLKFALSMYILEVTGSAALFATFLSVAMVPTIVLSPFGGILADRGNRRRIMVTLDACAGLAVLLAALTLPLGHALGVIGALLVVLSVLGAFESPTVQACVPQMLEGEDLVRGNAVVAQVQAVASLATPFLGSVLYAAVGLVPVLWGAEACFLVTALLECCLQLPPPAPVEGLGVREVLKQDLAASGRFLWREEPGMLKLLLLAALVSFFLAGVLVVGFPFLVRTVLGLSAAHYGGAESALGVAAVLGSLWVGLLAGKLRPVRSGAGHWGCWPVSAPGGADLPAAPGNLGAVWGAGGGVLPVPVWVQLLLHLCHCHHPGADPSGSHGEGDVLCVHPLPLRPAPGAAGVWRPV